MGGDNRKLAVAVLLAVLLVASPAQQPVHAWSFSGAWSKLWSRCQFVENPAEAVSKTLRAEVVAQDGAIDTLVSAIGLWQQDRAAGTHYPLVLAISGTTGVGKSASATAIAKAVLTNNAGFLELRGEDYHDENNTALSQHRVKTQVVTHAQLYADANVILIDEAQKMADGVIDVLKPALEHESPHMTHYIDGATQKAAFHNTIFIIISDIGVGKLTGLVAADGDQARIAGIIRGAMNRYWKGFEIGGFIESAVVFLPLTPEGVGKVVKLRLNALGQLHADKKWASLEFDSGVLQYLTSQRFISYLGVRHAGTIVTRFAKYGARDVFTSLSGPVNSLKIALYRVLRPFDPTRHVQVHMKSSDEVQISVCDHEAKACVERWSGALVEDSKARQAV